MRPSPFAERRRTHCLDSLFRKYRIIDTDQTVAALRALAHAHRLAAYRALVRAGPDGMAVGELRAALGLAPATLTAHLNVLRGTGLIDDERQGRVIRLRANYARMYDTH